MGQSHALSSANWKSSRQRTKSPDKSCAALCSLVSVTVHANVSSFLSRNVSSDVAEKPRGFPRLHQEIVRKEVKNVWNNSQSGPTIYVLPSVSTSAIETREGSEWK